MIKSIITYIKRLIPVGNNSCVKVDDVPISADENLEIVMSIEGQVSRAEALVLMSLASSISSDKVIVEIGTYRGRSTVALALGAAMNSCKRVYAIDPHTEFVGVLGGQFGPEDQSELYKNIIKADVGKIVSVVSLSSVAASKSWSEKNIGLLWIDGDHRYQSVRSDYELWSPFLSDEGIIAFHDANVDGVRMLIDELVEANCISKLGDVAAIEWFCINRNM